MALRVNGPLKVYDVEVNNTITNFPMTLVIIAANFSEAAAWAIDYMSEAQPREHTHVMSVKVRGGDGGHPLIQRHS